MSLGKTVVIEVSGKEVICRELTVADLRAAISAETAPDVVGNFLFSEVRLRDLSAMTSLSEDEISAMRPSDLRSVLEACKRANPDFFEMAARLSLLAAK